MKIILDISHPADVHQFKHFVKEMKIRGHTILFTCREKEFVINLLEDLNIEYISFGHKPKSLVGKILGLIKFTLSEMKIAYKFKPDIFLSHGSVPAAITAFLMRKPHISFEDTFNFEQVNVYLPFTDVVLTGQYEHPLVSQKVIRYHGYHELMYLTPRYFEPELDINSQLGLIQGEEYLLIRFVAWNATHDIGHHGLSDNNKIKAVQLFNKYCKIFISAEGFLAPELEEFRIQIHPKKMHSVLANAKLIFSESATMATEAAVLGTPAIYLDKKGTLYTKDIEKNYGLIFNYSVTPEDQDKAIEKAIEILKSDQTRRVMQHKKEVMLQDKIDVTAFLIWFVENYPQSVTIMKGNPDYQLRFK